MSLELSGRIFFQLPIRNSAHPAHPFEPFVSQPTGGPAVAGVGYNKSFIAVSCDPGLIPHLFDGFDTMQDSFS